MIPFLLLQVGLQACSASRIRKFVFILCRGGSHLLSGEFLLRYSTINVRY